MISHPTKGQLNTLGLGGRIGGFLHGNRWGITSRQYTEEMLTEVFIIYLINAIQQVVMTSCPKIIT